VAPWRPHALHLAERLVGVRLVRADPVTDPDALQTGMKFERPPAHAAVIRAPVHTSAQSPESRWCESARARHV